MPRRKHNARTKKAAGGGSKSSRRRARGGRNSGGSAASTTTSPPPPLANFVPEAGPGCHIATDVDVDVANGGASSSSWTVGSERYDPDDYPPGVDIPDLALNPDENEVSVTNVHEYPRVCYVTIYDATVLDGSGVPLRAGSTTDNEGHTRVCTTLIVLCPPVTFVHLCRVDVSSAGKSSLVDVEIDTDIQEWSRHPDPDDVHPYPLGFPFRTSGASASTGDGAGDDGDVADDSAADSASAGAGAGGYLCTQGVDGRLTHFFSGNHHAIDFRCPEGTPLLAVGDGTVVEVGDSNSLTGIAVSNLFTWNSVMIELDTADTAGGDGDGGDGDGAGGDGDDATTTGMRGGPLFVEYVHILKGSAVVAVGDRVSRGQLLCRSGSVGFSPEPHLHLAAYRDASPTAPTVGVRFACDGGGTTGGGGRRSSHFVPRAGGYYDRNGLVDRT